MNLGKGRRGATLERAGEMARRVQELDWAATELGEMDTWAPALRTAVDILLHCGFPATLQWGPNAILLYNDAYIPLIGERHPVALGAPILETFPEIASVYRPLLQRVHRGETIVLRDQLFHYKRDQVVEDSWFDLTYSPVHGANGEVAGVLAIGLETTDKVVSERSRAHLEAERLRSEDALQKAFSIETVGVLFFNLTGRIDEANEAFARMTGYSREELRGPFDWRSLTHTRYLPLTETAAAQLAGTGDSAPYEKEMVRKDGSHWWALCAPRRLRGEGVEAECVEFVIDITERKRAEERLRATHERQAFMLRLSDALRPIGDPIEIQGRSATLLGEYMHVNRALYAEILGSDVLIRQDYARGVASLASAAPFPIMSEEVRRRIERGESMVVNDIRHHPAITAEELTRFDDAQIAAFMGTSLVKDGRCVAVFNVHSAAPREWTTDELELLKDVAERTWAAVERASAEAALKESERYFRALVTASSDVLFRMSPDWGELRQLRGNGFLVDTHTPTSKWLQQYIPAEDHEKVLAGIAESLTKRTIFQQEHRVIRTDGTTGYAFSRAVPLSNERGQILEWFGAATDVTLRVRAEGALRDSEKLAVVGRLATSIAHEINNPLEAVTNLLFLAEMGELPPDARKYLQMAQSELARVGHIASETLRFHKQSASAWVEDFGQLVNSVVALHEGRLRGAQVTVHRGYRDHKQLLCYPNEVRQVLANLVGNALDAMLERKRRELFLRVRPARDRRSGREGIRVTIGDTGSGMTRATKQRIFEPFFTTKEATGTGLGLWVSQEIIRKHEGVLQVRSRRGSQASGTVFALFLPFRERADEGRKETAA